MLNPSVYQKVETFPDGDLVFVSTTQISPTRKEQPNFTILIGSSVTSTGLDFTHYKLRDVGNRVL